MSTSDQSRITRLCFCSLLRLIPYHHHYFGQELITYHILVPLAMVQSNLATPDNFCNETHNRNSPSITYSYYHHQAARGESPCYFTYIPSAPSDHWSLETPLPSPNLSTAIAADPHNPLLAARLPLLTPSTPQIMSAAKLMQYQTAVAHPQRPRPQPHQDVFELNNGSMTSSRSSSDSTSSSSSSRTPKMCSRCQTTFGDFVAYSLNGYYCKRCAKITGYGG